MNENLLHGPIAPRLVRLALPILVVLAVQTLVSVAETYFVGFLGTAAITGAAQMAMTSMAWRRPLLRRRSNSGPPGSGRRSGLFAEVE